MERLRAWGRRWPWLGTALAVHDRVGETRGGVVASAATLMAFTALFPLLLVTIAVVGFLSVGNADLAADLADGLGLEGQAADVITDAVDTARQSRRTATVLGALGLLWSGLGVTAAVTLLVRTPWRLPDPGLRGRLSGLAWLAGGLLTFAGALIVGALLNRLPNAVPRPVTAASLILAGLALELAFFLWTFWVLGDRTHGWRSLLPGAAVGAVGFETLKLAGTVVVPRMVASSSSLYGPLGAVFALLAWLALFSRLVVSCSALNAVRAPGTPTAADPPTVHPRTGGAPDPEARGR